MHKTISLNSLLIIINGIIIISLLVLFIERGSNSYVDSISVILGSLLAIETMIILRYSLKQKNSILLILGLILTFFYSFRVLTLLYIPFSVVFLRCRQLTPSDVNLTLLYVIVSSFFFYIGVTMCRAKCMITKEYFKVPSNMYFKPRSVLILILLIFVLTFFLNIGTGIFSVLAAYITSLFLNLFYLLLACWVFILYYGDRLTRKMKYLFYSIFTLFVFLQILGGSRSALLNIALILLFGALSFQSVLYLRIKHLIAVVLLIPIAIVFFLISTFIRQTDSRDSSMNEKIDLLSAGQFAEFDNIDIVLAPVFDRIGFLDYATEMIVEEDRYSSVINPWYYFKSIVDNVISPGFNIFDTPKVSNAFIFIYDDRGSPKLSKITADSYQSDQITVFGEFYTIFGRFFSLVIFMAVGYLFQRLQVKKSTNSLLFYIRNAFILNAFFILINSFGLDWFLFDVLSFIMTFIFFMFIFRLKLGKSTLSHIVIKQI